MSPLNSELPLRELGKGTCWRLSQVWMRSGWVRPKYIMEKESSVSSYVTSEFYLDTLGHYHLYQQRLSVMKLWIEQNNSYLCKRKEIGVLNLVHMQPLGSPAISEANPHKANAPPQGSIFFTFVKKKKQVFSLNILFSVAYLRRELFLTTTSWPYISIFVNFSLEEKWRKNLPPNAYSFIGYKIKNFYG